MNLARRENFFISMAVFVYFLLFLLSWSKDGGAWVFGLYSEVDGQFFAWTSKYLLQWGSPSDSNTLNPFGGMVSIFTPINSWWNPAALPLALPSSKLINFTLSYSIYWLEIFFAIYFLAKTMDFNKILSLLAAELFVLLVFPPFSAHFHSTPLYSLAPIVAQTLALMSLMAIAYAKLGDKGIVRNLVLLFLFVLACFLLIMSSGMGFIPAVPIYGLLFLGLTLHRFDRRRLLWQLTALFLIACLFLSIHGPQYYKATVESVASSLSTTKTAISLAIPTSLQAHRSIFYGIPPLFSYLNIFALLGSLVGMIDRKGKHRWLSFFFFSIILLPDVMGFLIENSILLGSITSIGIDYYVWCSYPIYCIASVLFIAYLWQLVTRIKNAKLRSAYFHSFKLLIPFIIPVLAAQVWFGSLHKNAAPLSEPSKTPLVAYLENQLALTPGSTFRGTTAAYFSSQNSPLRQLNGPLYEKNLASAARYTEYDYILSREFLNKRFHNRYMFTDLWNFNIPTLEEYGHWVTASMSIFFQEMLADKNDNIHGNFLNIYKLDLRVIRALGARYIIADKALPNKELSLVMVENQDFPSPMQTTNYIDYQAALYSKKIYDELLENEFKTNNVLDTAFIDTFMQRLETKYPLLPQDQAKLSSYLTGAFSSALGHAPNKTSLTHEELALVRNYFYSILFTWASSPTLYLYELKNPNLATFSPTEITQSKTAKDLFQKMRSPGFSFEKSLIVQDDLPTTVTAHLTGVKHSELRFERNRIRIKAESKGWSALLLPLQYSHCFVLSEAKPQSKATDAPRFIRANLIQGALVFKQTADVTLQFNFGLGKDLLCRQQDFQDLQSLDLKSQFRNRT